MVVMAPSWAVEVQVSGLLGLVLATMVCQRPACTTHRRAAVSQSCAPMAPVLRMINECGSSKQQVQPCARCCCCAGPLVAYAHAMMAPPLAVGLHVHIQCAQPPYETSYLLPAHLMCRSYLVGKMIMQAIIKLCVLAGPAGLIKLFRSQDAALEACLTYLPRSCRNCLFDHF